MIALDTNILIYAHRSDSQWHGAAGSCIGKLAEGRAIWAIPWPCVHEFLAIATHPAIYSPASTIVQALDQVGAWFESPNLEVVGEGEDHWTILREQLVAGQVHGPLVHDARVAAICISCGVREFLTADRDFSRFPELKTRNPLISA